MPKRTVEYYQTLPYTKRVEPRTDSNGECYFLAWVEEVAFIQIDGPTREEALGRLIDVFQDCIEGMIESGDDVPEPLPWPARVGDVDPSQFELLPRQGGDQRKLVDWEIAPAPWTVLENDSRPLTTA